jgi:hypothetical protein
MPSSALERLIALEGRPMWASIVRGADAPVVRNGTLRLFEPDCDVQTLREAGPGETFARIVDAAGLPIVALRGGDPLSLFRNLLSAELGPAFRADLLDRAFPDRAGAAGVRTYEAVARELHAELEAGFRSELLRQSEPLADRSVRFAVGHAAATLYPDGDYGIRLKCVFSEVRFEQQFTTIYVPPRGSRYVRAAAEVERLGADIRAFMSNERAGFTLAAS